MELFTQQVLAGLATGGIYASLALALVMIYQTTELVNFAQGEMAMFATFITWSIAAPTAFDRMPLWLVYVVGVLIAGVMGAAIERIIIRPVENAPVLSVVVVTLGLFIVFNSL
ncbi:MAG: branched-chain amino acid ABC transporter permease, partial [Rhodothermales bacterium]